MCVFFYKKTTPQNPETLWSLCKRNPWSVAKSVEKGQIINKLAFISRVGLRKRYVLHAVNIILSFWTASSKIVWGTTPLNNWIAEKSGECFFNLFDLFSVMCNYLCAELFLKEDDFLDSQAPNRYTDLLRLQTTEDSKILTTNLIFNRLTSFFASMRVKGNKVWMREEIISALNLLVTAQRLYIGS